MGGLQVACDNYLSRDRNSSKGSLKGYGALLLFLMLPLGISLIIGHVVLSMLGSFDFLMVGFAADLYNTMIGVYQTIDSLFIMIFAAFFALILYNAFRTNMHPVLGVFGLFGLGGLVIVSGAVSSMFKEFTGVSEVTSSANAFPMIVTFFQNIEITTAVLGILLLFVMVGGVQRLR